MLRLDQQHLEDCDRIEGHSTALDAIAIAEAMGENRISKGISIESERVETALISDQTLSDTNPSP
jgi:hypothetical protein